MLAGGGSQRRHTNPWESVKPCLDCGSVLPVRDTTVLREGPQEDERWDRFVYEHPGGTVYHLAAWSQILAKAYRFRPRYLKLESEDGELRGVMPLTSRRGLITGTRMRSLPVIAIGGPLGADEPVEVELLRAACEEACERGCQLWIDSARPLPEGRDPQLREAPRPPTWVSALPADGELEAWLRERSNNLRRGVNRARKRGVEVRLADSASDLRSFYRLYLATMRKHGSPPRSWTQLSLSRELLGKRVFRLFLAEHEGKAVAGGIFHEFNDTLELLYNGSDAGALDLRPNHGLYEGVIDWAGKRGLKSLDLGFAPEGSNLANFKQQWGGELVPRFHYMLPASGMRRAAATRVAASTRRRAGPLSTLWGRMPVALTRASAIFYYRYL